MNFNVAKHIEGPVGPVDLNINYAFPEAALVNAFGILVFTIVLTSLLRKGPFPIILVGLFVIAYLTNPDEDSFIKYMELLFQKSGRTWIRSKLEANILAFTREDRVFFSTTVGKCDYFFYCYSALIVCEMFLNDLNCYSSGGSLDIFRYLLYVDSLQYLLVDVLPSVIIFFSLFCKSNTYIILK